MARGGGERSRDRQIAIWIFVLVLFVDGLNLFGDKIGLAQGGFMLEDGFYYLTLARQFVHGNGFSLDGLNPTTGFHPLHLALLLPFAWIQDPWTFMRAAVGLCSVYHALAAAGLFLLLRRALSPRAALALTLLWGLAASVRQATLNGMETGLFLALALWTLVAFERAKALPDPKRLLPTGLLLGLSYWARTDALFLGLGLGASLLIERPPQWRERFQWIGVPALAVVLPWLAISTAYSGHPFPESGPASRRLALELGDGYLRGEGLETLAHEGAVCAQSALDRGLRYSAASALLATVWSAPCSVQIGWQHPYFWDAWSEYPFSRLAAKRPWVAAFILLLLVLTASWGWARVGLWAVPVSAVTLWLAYAWLPAPSWFFIRYTVWFGLFFGPGLILAASQAFPWHRSVRWFAWLGLALCALVYVRQYRQLFPRTQEPRGFLAQALWAKDHLPPGSIVASFQNGVFSYFSGFPSINLDGVANAAAWQAKQAGRLPAFLASSPATYLADSDGMINLFLPVSALGQEGVTLRPLKRDFFSFYQIRRH